MNDYYSRGTPTRESELVQAAFDKLPPLTGNANEVVVVNAGATALTSVTEAVFNASIHTELGLIQDSLAGYLVGCIPANGSDATNDIDFSAGFAFDGTRGYTVGAKTKRADATWAAGTGAGGHATGATAWGAADWHLFVLLNPTTGGTDFGFDTSLTGVNLLADSAVIAAGFTVVKRCSSLRTAGAAWPLFAAQEIAVGQVEYLLKTPAFEINKNWTGADDTAQTGTLALVPGGIKVHAILGVLFQDSSASAASALLITSLDQTDTAANVTVAAFLGQFKLVSNGGGNSACSGIVIVLTSTSRTFRYRGQDTTADHDASFCTMGWRDSRL